MKRVAIDTRYLTRRQRWRIRWQIRRMGAKLLHTPHVPRGTAVIFDPEEAEERLRRDLAKPRRFT